MRVSTGQVTRLGVVVLFAFGACGVHVRIIAYTRAQDGADPAVIAFCHAAGHRAGRRRIARCILWHGVPTVKTLYAVHAPSNELVDDRHPVNTEGVRLNVCDHDIEVRYGVHPDRRLMPEPYARIWGASYVVHTGVQRILAD